jgi:hypothetical protein
MPNTHFSNNANQEKHLQNIALNMKRINCKTKNKRDEKIAREKITKDKLYKSALDLYKIKDSLGKHLSQKTNELFDLQDKIYL